MIYHIALIIAPIAQKRCAKGIVMGLKSLSLLLPSHLGYGE